MRSVYLILGIGILVAVIVDILWTTLWVDGGSGPIASRLTSAVWRGLRIASNDRSRVLSVAGPLILTLTLATWVGLLWIGWSFLFAGSGQALLDTRTGDPATWSGRFYYVAYTMFTNGNGDYTPNGATWEIASSFTTATGMLFVTLGVSYVLSVLGAVSQKRSFASSVTGLGTRSESFVRTGWTESEADFRGITLSLDRLASELGVLAEQHKSYPILHYYHSETGEQASAMAVPIFDDALTIFRYGVPADAQPRGTLIKSGRSNVDRYLETLDTAYIEAANETPPSPDLERLREDNIPTVADDAFDDALEDVAERRRKLLGVVEADAWHWPPEDELGDS